MNWHLPKWRRDSFSEDSKRLVLNKLILRCFIEMSQMEALVPQWLVFGCGMPLVVGIEVSKHSSLSWQNCPKRDTAVPSTGNSTRSWGQVCLSPEGRTWMALHSIHYKSPFVPFKSILPGNRCSRILVGLFAWETYERSVAWTSHPYFYPHYCS